MKALKITGLTLGITACAAYGAYVYVINWSQGNKGLRN